MEYSLITKNENGCQIVVRSANSLENLIRNIVIDNVRYLRGIDRDTLNDHAYIDNKNIGNSFKIKYKFYDKRKENIAYLYSDYKIMCDELTINIYKIIPIWNNIYEEIKNSTLYKKSNKDCYNYRKGPYQLGFEFRKSPQHYGRIRVRSELRKNKGYEIYRNENKNLKLPKSRKLPESWEINDCQRFNVRGERDWKRNKCRKQWMKHKVSTDHSDNIKMISYVSNIIREAMIEDIIDGLYQVSEGFYCSEKKESLDEFYKTYADDIEEELSNNGSYYNSWYDYDECYYIFENNYHFEPTVKRDICGKDHIGVLSAINRLNVCSLMCDDIRLRYENTVAYDNEYMTYDESEMYNYHIFKMEQKRESDKAA